MEIFKTNYKGVLVELPKSIHEQRTASKVETIKDRILMGDYERVESDFAIKYYDNNDVVLELGGCLGIVSCIMAKIVNNLVTVEPNTNLNNIINNHKKINNVDFILENTIVSNNNTDIVEFHVNPFVLGSGLYSKSSNIIKIKTTTISDLEKKHNLKFNTLHCDIEGFEFDFLKNNINEIKTKFNKIIIETHYWMNLDNGYDVLAFLSGNGYELIQQHQGIFFLKSKRNNG